MQSTKTPELRFKKANGAEYADWEEKRLGEVGATYTGLSGKSKEDFNTGDSKYITYMNVYNNILINTDIFENILIQSNENQNLVKKGDIFFTTSSETAEEVGMSSILTEDNIKDLYLNSFCIGYRLNNIDNYNLVYFAYMLRSNFIRKRIIYLAQGSTRYNLSKNSLMNIAIPLPSMEEQEKIAGCLSSLDRVIEKGEEETKNLKEYKKGLMQKLFPRN